ncbi:MAG: ATP-binding cassette domain-containing protein [Clostridia bacterium]|nr:ATP-binding cassette domain-containing protein [Clostridia bacterium]
MNAIEIRNLKKNFGIKRALSDLDLTVPEGSIYGLIGENGCGKTTTEKIICGLLGADGGSVKLFGKSHTDEETRAKIGALIEAPGCFPNLSVWNNMMIQADNLGIENAEEEVVKILKTVRMEGAAGNKYKNCSLGMKQRIGIAMALLGNPELLILDEPLNGLDADGMRIMREILTDLTQKGECSVLISSHILGELEKIATHYGIMRNGKIIREMTARELEENCRTYVAVRAGDMSQTKTLLELRYMHTDESEDGYLRVYDAFSPEDVVSYLYKNGITVTEIKSDKIGLEEYYIDLMSEVSK